MSLSITSAETPITAAPGTVSPSPVIGTSPAGFVDRRATGGRTGTGERRQFGSSHSGLTDDGRELALAIDRYKVQHHRRYITCDEMLAVITSLGYRKVDG